jgi:hypothetical protein
MDTILQEIEKALNAKLYYLAVAMALTLPDICAALASPDGESSGPKYKDWYNANLAKQYSNITDVDCWKLRCGVLHQGRCGHPQMQYDRIIFTMPGHGIVHNNIMSKALNLDASVFCKDVIATVRAWLKINQNDSVIRANVQNLVKFRQNGLPPYIVGMPVIA